MKNQIYEELNHEIMLSISLLVSNRIDTIEKCMESLQPLIKAVPAEIIAVDTGSTDGSIDVVRRYTDKIIEFTWCDDFAAARNAGLKEAKGKWFLFLDDDEWFESTEEIIDFLVSGEEKRFAALRYEVRNYRTFDDTTIYEPAVAARMSLRTKELRFEGRIHEYLSPGYGPIKYVHDFVHHYGYVFSDQEEKEKHFQRNVSLLREEQKKDPENSRTLLQLAQECLFINDWEEAEKVIDKGIEVCKKQKGNYITWLIPMKARVYFETGRLEELEEYVKKWEHNSLVTDLSRAALYIQAIGGFCDAKKDVQGIHYAKEYIAIRSKLFKDEKKMREQAVLGLMQYVDWDHYTTTQSMLTLMLIREGHWEEGWKQIEKINWEIESENLIKILELVYVIADKSNAFNQLKNVINEILKQDRLEEKLYEVTEKSKSGLPARRDQIIDLFVGVRKESAYILLQKLLSARSHNNHQDMEVYFNRYLQLPYEERVYYADFLCVAFWEDLNVHELIEKLDLDHWESAILAVKDFTPPEQIEEFIEKIAGQMDVKDVKYLYARMMLFGKRLEKDKNYFSYLDEFLSARSEYLDVVGEKVKDNNVIYEKQRAIEVLRRAVVSFQEYDISQAKELVQGAIQLDLELEQSVIVFLEKIILTLKVEQGKIGVKDNPEFIYLAKQLKVNIRGLLAEGKKEEALELVKGLKSMVPEDEELEWLYKECV